MPKPIVYDGRADFRGGRNTSVSPDLLNPTELQDCTNARLSNDQIGAIIKRNGTQRMHNTALPTPILGITQWDAPSGKQTVVIAGDGNLYFKAQGIGGDFTKVVPGTAFSTTQGYVDFADFRSTASGAPLLLFIADGLNLQTWDGTSVITLLTPTNGAPEAGLVRQCLTRLFAVDSRFVKNMYWSRLGDGTYWLTGLGTDGGVSAVDTFRGNAILHLECVVNSMLIFTRYSISRFTGTDFTNITISTDTAGVTDDVGIVGFRACDRVEQVLAYVSDQGPYWASEVGVTPYGVDVQSDFDNIDRSQLSAIAVAYHKGRKEVWHAVSFVGDAHTNQNVFAFNTRLQNWAGPYIFPFGIVAMTQYIDAAGSAWIMAACSDGYVRHMDIGSLDDVLANGTGGSNYTMSVVLSPIFFPVGPLVSKGLKRFNVQANLPVNTAMHVQSSFDGIPYVDWGAITGLGNFSANYRVDASGVGHRLTVKFTDASSGIPILNGLITEAYNYARPE